MIDYLLDTNILSEMVRNPSGAAATSAASKRSGSIATSPVVVGELYFGALMKGSKKLERAIETVLRPIPILTIDEEVALAYARIRRDLERAGTPIGANDLLIAAHALCLDLTLVTANEREFQRVDGLGVENWLKSPPPAP